MHPWLWNTDNKKSTWTGCRFGRLLRRSPEYQIVITWRAATTLTTQRTDRNTYCIFTMIFTSPAHALNFQADYVSSSLLSGVAWISKCTNVTENDTKSYTTIKITAVCEWVSDWSGRLSCGWAAPGRHMLRWEVGVVGWAWSLHGKHTWVAGWVQRVSARPLRDVLVINDCTNQIDTQLLQMVDWLWVQLVVLESSPQEEDLCWEGSLTQACHKPAVKLMDDQTANWQKDDTMCKTHRVWRRKAVTRLTSGTSQFQTAWSTRTAAISYS